MQESRGKHKSKHNRRKRVKGEENQTSNHKWGKYIKVELAKNRNMTGNRKHKTGQGARLQNKTGERITKYKCQN